MKKFIIDVSSWKEEIDWEKVKPQIDGAILRCGYGTDHESQDDVQFKRNADECTRLGIPFGVYLYSYAKTVEQAKSEAAHALRLVKGYKLSYPIYLDLEENGTQEGAVERANIFGDMIEEAGYMCGIYANLNWWNHYLKGLDRFTRWVAQYYKACTYSGSYDMWQYSSSGAVDGIPRGVDVNECYRDFPAELNPGENSQVNIPDKEPESTDHPKIKEWQKAAIADGFAFPRYGADGIWGNECASVAEKAIVKKRDVYKYKNLTRIVQKAVGTKVDGLCGPKTDAAIRAYQEKNGLAVDGAVGINTWKKILGV